MIEVVFSPESVRMYDEKKGEKKEKASKKIRNRFPPSVQSQKPFGNKKTTQYPTESPQFLRQKE